ncbi:MAG: molybdenum ABC transporter ATP-binding protein [Sulfurifustaceae bacterium]
MSAIDVRLDTVLGTFRLAARFTAPVAGFTALFGPSGAGKTTVLRCVAGLVRAGGARVCVGDDCWQDEARAHFVPAHRRAIGYVFQEASLFSHLSVRDNLAYGWRRTPAAERRIAFEQAVEWLGLGTLLARQPQRLSGGERQRVAIARALLASPRLLLLDEPLSGLDETAKTEIVPYLVRLHRELSIPALYVSHSLDEVARLCDHVVLLDKGRVSAHGTLDALLTRLDLPLAHGDHASAVIDAAVAGDDATFQLKSLAFDGGTLFVTGLTEPTGARVRVRVHARDVSIALVAPQRTSVLNVLPARILEIADDAPGSVIVRLAVGNTILLARITRKSASLLALAAGMPVYAQIKGVAVLP